MRTMFIFASLFLLLISGVSAVGKKEITFRPVNLLILDELTKEPLEGVSVKVINSIARYKYFFFLWFPIDSDKQENNFFFEYKTNGKGEVHIPEYVYRVRNNYTLNGQYVLLNIEAIDEKKRGIAQTFRGMYYLPYDREEYYFRPISEYKAFQINFSPYRINTVRQQRESTKPYITEIYIEYDIPQFYWDKRGVNSFHHEAEELVIPLQRFVRSVNLF